jgi:ATP-dependent RNA helicase DeaD
MLVPVWRRQAAEQMLARAKINAIWSPAPSADAIRARDEERLTREIAAMAEAPAEEDLAAGRILLTERSPEELAATLVRLRRELLPAPEELDDAISVGNEARAKKSRPRAMRGRVQRAPKRKKRPSEGNRH